MLNANNIALFDEGEVASGFEYIVGDRIKSLSTTSINHLTNIENYSTTIVKNNNNEDVPIRYCS